MTLILSTLEVTMVALGITGLEHKENDVNVVVKTGSESNTNSMGGLIGSLSDGGLVIIVVLIVLIVAMCCCGAMRWVSPYLSMGRALQERQKEEEEQRKRELALVEREEREVKAKARRMILGMKQ